MAGCFFRHHKSYFIKDLGYPDHPAKGPNEMAGWSLQASYLVTLTRWAGRSTDITTDTLSKTRGRAKGGRLIKPWNCLKMGHDDQPMVLAFLCAIGASVA